MSVPETQAITSHNAYPKADFTPSFKYVYSPQQPLQQTMQQHQQHHRVQQPQQQQQQQMREPSAADYVDEVFRQFVQRRQ
jgi:hypothetical protein